MNAFLEKMAQLDPNPVAHTEAGTPESGVTDEAYQNYVGTQKTDTGLEKYPNLKNQFDKYNANLKDYNILVCLLLRTILYFYFYCS